MFQTTKQFSIFGTAVSAFWAPVKMAPVINGTAPATDGTEDLQTFDLAEQFQRGEKWAAI